MPKQAILSVSDKTGIVELAQKLVESNYELLGSGGTADFIRQANIPIREVSEITQFPEILGGRVKTLHPAVHGGILAQSNDRDNQDLITNHIAKIDLVVCNLYAFKETLRKPGVTYDMAVEEIDIGGVTLLRAAAKNSKRVCVLSTPNQYKGFIEQLKFSMPISEEFRNSCALAAFRQTADYDEAIAGFFRSICGSEINLRYGLNPYQTPARVFMKSGSLPFKILNGSPGYINLLDALNAYPLVKELSQNTNYPAAASFKHVSPAGAAIGSDIPLSDTEKIMYGLEMEKDQITGIAKAYSLARGCDRMSSFGDFIALSAVCDETTARIISREVSDGIIAPGYCQEAIEILRKKKGGNFLVLQIDPMYEPDKIETRQVYGIQMQQKINDLKIDRSCFQNIVSKSKQLNEQAFIDMIVAATTIKYTQSNSVCLTKNGMVIGIGAGQQSRIHCTRLAGDKADSWWLRQHPKVLAIKFKKESKRPERANAIDLYVTNQFNLQRETWESNFEQIPSEFSQYEREQWLSQLKDVTCCSDAFFPFSDNLYRLVRSGVKFVAAPGGSVADKQVFSTADDLNIVFCKFPMRLFTH